MTTMAFMLCLPSSMWRCETGPMLDTHITQKDDASMRANAMVWPANNVQSPRVRPAGNKANKRTAFGTAIGWPVDSLGAVAGPRTAAPQSRATALPLLALVLLPVSSHGLSLLSLLLRWRCLALDPSGRSSWRRCARLQAPAMSYQPEGRQSQTPMGTRGSVRRLLPATQMS